METKKVSVFSLYSNFNFGNKLQVYAIQYICTNLGLYVKIIRNSNSKKKKPKNLINIIKKIFRFVFPNPNYLNNNFKKFEKKLKVTRKYYCPFQKNINLLKKYNYFIVGSDQVWNPNFGLVGNFKYLDFVINKTKIAFAASFGVENVPNETHAEYTKGLKKFNYISVREERGKEIVEELTGRKDIEVLVDPTMLLTAEEWDKVSKRPRMLKSNKYILTYFLGALSDERKKIINKITKENNCDVINLLDKNDPFFECGPSEFLFLEKNAFLICTDSFHSSVFAILYNTPFLVYDREDNNVSMNSRIDTLLSKFKLEERKYKGKITKNDLKCNYIEAFKILERERKKAFEFLEKALDIKDSD